MSASTRWRGPRGGGYDARWEALAAAGASVHGEADLVDELLAERGGRRVLDAGCGTGRVAVELARRDYDVVGVDLDTAMLDAARDKAPDLTWVEADLVALDLGSRFDAVVLAGNVMIFVAPETEGAVLARLAAHLRPRGLVIAGFQLRLGGLTLADYDRHAADAGLVLEHRFATWERAPYDGGDYAVSVHRAPDQ